ncbi:MAG: MaoC family dehydratase [Bacteroidia bacterium]|nr:MaoC family dehydratase [Bacteroidia bacterium]
MFFKVGDKKCLKKIFSQEEVDIFSKISMDSNKIHFDNEYCVTTRFGKPIVQGPYLTSLIGGVIGSHIPGEGAIYLSQNTNFKKPIYIGEPIEILVEITDFDEQKNIIKLQTTVVKGNNILAIEGTAIILYLKN